MKEQALELAMVSLKTESNAISDIIDYLDREQFSKAVEVLSNCSKIITCGSGTSGIAAKKFAHSLCCIEKSAYFLSPSEAVHGGLGCVDKGDAVVIVSRGGKTVELMPIIDVCDKKGAIIIAITENLDSPLAKTAQVIVQLKVKKESDKYNVMATSSFVATIAIFDAMLVAIMEKIDYKIEQFSLIHPGGAVGEMLNRTNTTTPHKF